MKSSLSNMMPILLVLIQLYVWFMDKTIYDFYWNDQHRFTSEFKILRKFS